MKQNFDLAVIGGGPAGLAAALEAYNNGVKNIIIIERDRSLGGILNQCIHNGFGLHYFKQELTGPEYAAKFIEMIEQTTIEIALETMVLHLNKDKQIHTVSSKNGYNIIKAKAIILAMGCRERNKGPIEMPGERGSGVFSAGSAQKYINIDGYMVGKEAVILGSGDIGLIMARRLTLEGAKVHAVVEIMPHSNGLSRNKAQCLDDYDIPLYLSHTVTDVIGDRRIKGVVVSKVDENLRPINGTEMHFDCDTLLLSVGLVPENELSKDGGIQIDSRTNGAIVSDDMQTQSEGIFACGNVLHVHDLVDFVTQESQKAGKNAANYILYCNQNTSFSNNHYIEIKNGDNVTYTVPQKVKTNSDAKIIEIFFRVRKKFGKSIIKIAGENGLIKEIKREYMAPGEMEKIVLTKQAICSDGAITISVQEGC